MSGLFQLSLHQITDGFGQPMHGCLTFFYETATLDPLPVWVDSGCTVPATNPVVADGFGRIPTVYIASGGSGFYRVRVTSAEGAIVPGLDLQTLPVVTSSTGGGSPATSPVDPATLAQTGDFVFAMSNGVRVGSVRANGNSIGNATSGATERANGDCLALFAYLYAYVNDSLCPVSGGRTGNANADFASSKRLSLPDMRGRAPFGRDAMSNVAAGRLTTATIIGGPDVAGAYGGVEKLALTTPQLPAHSHLFGTLAIAAGGGTHAHLYITRAQARNNVQTGGTQDDVWQGTAVTSTNPTEGTHTHTITGATAVSGSGGDHNNLSPALLGTWYLKL